MPGTNTVLVKAYRRHASLWKWFYGVLLSMHFLLGGASVVAPLLIASNLFGAGEALPTKILALIGAIAAALVTFLRPSQYAQGFYSAYSLLEPAIDRYEMGSQGTGREDALIDAMTKARILIGAAQPAMLEAGTRDQDDDANKVAG